MWGARGEPPGQITTGAVIHFGEDPASQYDKVMCCEDFFNITFF